MAARVSAAAAALADRRVEAARAALVLDEPFWGMLSLQLDLVNDPSAKTAWTNGKSLGYSPAYVATLNDEELKGLIAHEVMHCACGHPWRRAGRDLDRANIAMDYAINGPLIEAGFVLPDGALLSSEFTGHCFEWIFDRLPESQDGDEGDGAQDAQDGAQDGAGGANGAGAGNRARTGTKGRTGTGTGTGTDHRAAAGQVIRANPAKSGTRPAGRTRRQRRTGRRRSSRPRGFARGAGPCRGG